MYTGKRTGEPGVQEGYDKGPGRCWRASEYFNSFWSEFVSSVSWMGSITNVTLEEFNGMSLCHCSLGGKW